LQIGQGKIHRWMIGNSSESSHQELPVEGF
jgi:hypothetical protein